MQIPGAYQAGVSPWGEETQSVLCVVHLCADAGAMLHYATVNKQVYAAGIVYGRLCTSAVLTENLGSRATVKRSVGAYLKGYWRYGPLHGCPGKRPQIA